MPAKPTVDGKFDKTRLTFALLPQSDDEHLANHTRGPGGGGVDSSKGGRRVVGPTKKGRNEVKTFGGTLVGLVPPLYAF